MLFRSGRMPSSVCPLTFDKHLCKGFSYRFACREVRKKDKNILRLKAATFNFSIDFILNPRSETMHYEETEALLI